MKNSRNDDVLLYIKHWYFKSGDVKRDLQIVFGYHNAYEPNINDMFEMFTSMFYEYFLSDTLNSKQNTEYLFREFLADCFPRSLERGGHREETATPWSMIQSMISKLSCHVKADQMESKEIDPKLEKILKTNKEE